MTIIDTTLIKEGFEEIDPREKIKLEGDEYLLKLIDRNPVNSYIERSRELHCKYLGIIAPLKKNGQVPVCINGNYNPDSKQIKCYKFKAEFRKGWRLIRYYTSNASSYVALLHPLGFEISVSFERWVNFCMDNTFMINNGYIADALFFEADARGKGKLISALSAIK